MSLQHAAKHLAAHGRGKDTELIHMDKGEIASLQQIAMAHGGSLTINPQTGLPEAGFLSAIMPMVAGAALTGLSGGVINPMTAGFMVGGLRTAQSGSLSKGIMAGFGAYGGAGLAQSFGTAGAVSQAAPSAGQAVAADTDAMAQAAQATQGVQSSVAPSIAQTTGAGGSLASSDQAFNAATQGGINGNTMTNAESFGASNPSAGIQAASPVQITPQGGTTFPGESAMQGTSYAGPSMPKSFADMTPSERISAMGRGASFENAYDYVAANPKSSLVAATGVAMGMQKGPPKPAEPDRDMGQRYSFTGGKLEPTPAPDVPTYDEMLTNRGNYGRQRQYFNNPTYTAVSPTAAKDLYNFAGGGMPVEQMSNNAAMGTNTMYPMANTATSSFATPYQAPQSTNMLANMVAPSGGGAVGAMSGEPNMQGTRMAEGGEAEGAVAESRPSYTYDAQTRKYTAGPSMGGGASNQTFDQKTEAAFNQFVDDVGKYGMDTPLGGRIGGNSNGIPSYAYNPQTRQYIQMAEGGIPRYRIGGDLDIQDAPDNQPVGPIGRLLGMTKRREQDANPGLGYTYNQDDQQYVQQQAGGGLSDARYNLGGYSDGGRLLRGPGDGVSDSIPAVIGKKQPARLADGEFVVPARIVSELGNGSTEAGARKLYAMLDRVQASRKRTVGKGKVAKNNRADKYLPA
jgi:hypothetical protein